MSRKKFPGLIALAWLVFVSACNLPGGPPAAAGTSPVPEIPLETLVAGQVAGTLTAQAGLVQAETATLAALATDTPQFTFTPSLSPTETFTLTPAVPMVSVTVNTNCRTGPNTSYDIVGVLNVGEKAEVVGRSTLTDTMIIKLPSKPTTPCWLWAGNATVTGDISGLPLIPIPPTPTPKYTATPAISFKLAYVSTDFCLGVYVVKFKITNDGVLTWESDKVTVTDQNTSTTKTITYDSFPYYSSTCDSLGDINLEKGEIGFTSSEQFADNPAGHAMTAVIRVCSLDGLLGTCLEKTISFTP